MSSETNEKITTATVVFVNNSWPLFYCSSIDDSHWFVTVVEHFDVSHLLIGMAKTSNDHTIQGRFAREDIFNFIEDAVPNVEQITLSCSSKGASINCSQYLEPIMTHICVRFTFNGLNSRDIYTDV